MTYEIAMPFSRNSDGGLVRLAEVRMIAIIELK